MTTQTFVPLSPCISSTRKYGLDPKFPVPSDKRTRNISNLKYYEFDHKNTRASSWTGNNDISRLIIRSRKEKVTVRSYSEQQHSNIPRHGGFAKLLRAIFEFSRPYAMYSTIINVISVATLPLTSLAQMNPAFLVGVLQALAVNMLARAYISGINDIYDVEIDKINKPHLPIASGALPMKFAVAIVYMCLLGSVTLGIIFRSPPLIFGALFSCLFGTLYSAELPFMRWKRYPILVGTVVVMINAVGIPFSTFLHIQKHVLGSPTMFFTKSLIFTSCFVTSASISLGFFKDIHDILGDKKHGLRTLAIRLGAERVFWICVSALVLTYGCAIGVGLTSSSLITKFVTIPAHFLIACVLLYQALSVDLSVKGSAEKFYMLLWKSFCSFLLFIDEMSSMLVGSLIQLITPSIQR